MNRSSWRAAFGAVAVAALLAGGLPAKASTLVNIDATDPNGQQILNLTAGKYKVTPVGSPPGTYVAWSPGAGFDWINNYTVLSPSNDIASVIPDPPGADGVNLLPLGYQAKDGVQYATPAEALANAIVTRFVLAADGPVWFFNYDANAAYGNSAADNEGGMSLYVSRVPVPAALPLFATGLGVLGFIGWRKRRSASA